LGVDKPHRKPEIKRGEDPSQNSAPTSSALVSEMLFIGIVGRPHGLKGAFFVASRTEPFPSDYKSIFIGPNRDKVRSASVSLARMQGDRSVIQCSLASSREEAETLTGQEMFVSSTLAHKVHKKDVIWADLMGCTVVSSSAKVVGTVTNLYDNGATGVIQITGLNADTADLPMVSAIFDLDDVTEIRGKKVLVCLLPDDAIQSFWSRELAKDEVK